MTSAKLVGFIWQVANLLRGPYRPPQYKDVMLPMTVLRRLDCVLEPTKQKVLAKNKEMKSRGIKNPDLVLRRITKLRFYNTSRFTFAKLKGDPNGIAANLRNYIKGFSPHAREIIEHFEFDRHIAKLDENNLLYKVVSAFAEMDMHPNSLPNFQMGHIFEDLVRRFNEASNEEAGDHFTPREVIRLMVDLLFAPDGGTLTTKSIIRTLYDPACGTGGMLSVADEHLRELNPDATLKVFGQDYNNQSYAICGSDMMIKGQDIKSIAFGDSFTKDSFSGAKFDYMLANPPFGVEWKPQRGAVEREHKEEGFGGRFGAGLPRISDGSLLFLQHMISKMKPPKDGGTRLAIVFNGSPLFTGGAGAGESEIRKWIIEHDWLEAIVALPDQLFYNTGIHTYLWIVTNRKEKRRRGMVQLINAAGFFEKMGKSLGNKRNRISEARREEIVKLHGKFARGKHVRLFRNEEFGYRRITVERPLQLNFAADEVRLARLRESAAFCKLAESKKRRDSKAAAAEIAAGKKLQLAILAALRGLKTKSAVKNREKFSGMLKDAFEKNGVKVSAALRNAILAALAERDASADVCKDAQGKPQPDPELRDYENVPLGEKINAYMKREVLPHARDAWVDEFKTKIGYEINFNRYFYRYAPPRPLAEIEADIKNIEKEIAGMLAEVAR